MSNLNANLYIYQPLIGAPDTYPIRLCRLAPAASQEEEIKCDLFNTTLDAKNDFEALSYTWGDAADTIPISIHDKQLYITRNLAVALQNLRHPNQQRVMWIDAICINQFDVVEKNQQVRQMKNIYGLGGARRVVVWLGVIPNARKAIDFCARMHFGRKKILSYTTELQNKRDRRKQYVSKPMLEQPYNDEAAEDAGKKLWAYMEENNHSRDPLTYFWNRSTVYQGSAEMDKDDVAKGRGHGSHEFGRSFLIDSSNMKRTASEAARLLWDRMREPNRCRDDDPVLEQNQFEGDSGNIIKLFLSQNPAAAEDLAKHIEDKRRVSNPGKSVWDLIQQDRDARQAARLLWEKVGEEIEAEVMHDLQYELLLEYEEENQACQWIFLDAPWWSRVWILQEVIHSGGVVVLLEQGDWISLEELLIAHDYWKAWKLLHKSDSLFARNFTSLRTRLQLLKSRDAEALALARAGKRDSPAIPQVPQPESTERDVYRNIFGKARQTTDLHGHFKDMRAAAAGAISPPTLASLILNFRNQHATDARDKIYALLGMAAAGSNGADITVDYQISIKKLYVLTARALAKKVLLLLLLVESPERAVSISGDSALPSWVPDYRTRQNSFPQFQLAMQNRFSADHGFPTVELEPRFRQAPDAETLTIRGLYVGVVTSIFDARLTDEDDSTGWDAVRLITYDRDPAARYKTASALELANRSGSAQEWDRPEPVKDSSWGPIHAEVGDSIIIVRGLSIPIVVRRIECESESRLGRKHLLVGGCWLIDSRLNSEMFTRTDWMHNSGFSPIMFGNALKNLPSDWKPEEFILC